MKPKRHQYQWHPKPLSSQELARALQELGGWSEQEGKLHRQFDFSSFEKALGFMSGLAIAGEAMAHHPQESNLYNCVTVELTTEEAGGITKLDLELARRANELAANLSN